MSKSLTDYGGIVYPDVFLQRGDIVVERPLEWQNLRSIKYARRPQLVFGLVKGLIT